MARTVRDAAILLGALAGADPRRPGDRGTSGRVPGDYTPYLDPNGLQGARIGVVRNYFGFHDGVDAVAQEALDVLRKAGATLVDPANLPNADKFDDAELLVLLYELKADLNAYLARLGTAHTSTRWRTSSRSTNATGRAKCPTSGRTCS